MRRDRNGVRPMSTSNPVRVLYMEDDIGIARLLQKKLQQAGFEVDLARDGEQGLAMCESHQYDVIAVDQRMPGYDGIDVIRILAGRGPLPKMIMITSIYDEPTAKEAFNLGLGEYITKDVQGRYLDMLPGIIQKMIES